MCVCVCACHRATSAVPGGVEALAVRAHGSGRSRGAGGALAVAIVGVTPGGAGPWTARSRARASEGTTSHTGSKALEFCCGMGSWAPVVQLQWHTQMPFHKSMPDMRFACEGDRVCEEHGRW